MATSKPKQSPSTPDAVRKTSLLREFTPTTSSAAHLNTEYSSPPAFSEDEFWNAFTNLGASVAPTTAGLEHRPDPLPGFLNPLPPTMSQEMIDYLEKNQVFCLPSARLQQALLHTFIECVLPSMPILEWQDFLAIIHDGRGGPGRVSLLLYWAVMFSATNYVDLHYLLEVGYLSRKEAHEDFFQKAKLLYNFRYESDPITIIQTLLLMTLRLDTADGYDSRHWIKAAITVARSVGLFQDIHLTPRFQCSPRLWKRIAWTCYMTDSVIALRLRCRTAIDQTEFGHPPLTEQDFDVGPLPSDIQIVSPACTVARNLQAQQDLASICIATARLCTCIGKILDLQGKHTTYTDSSTISLRSIITTTNTNTNNTDYMNHTETETSSPSTQSPHHPHPCELDLADWANTLPPPCQANPPSESSPHSSPSSFSSSSSCPLEHPTVLLHRNTLHMIFYTTLAVFHQSQPFPTSKSCVQLAASQISRITSELYQHNLQHRLPVIAVTAILVALIIHVADLERAAPASTERDEAVLSVRLCLDVMGRLRDSYWEAETAATWALSVIQNVAFDSEGWMGSSSSGESALEVGAGLCGWRFRERSASSESWTTEKMEGEGEEGGGGQGEGEMEMEMGMDLMMMLMMYGEEEDGCISALDGQIEFPFYGGMD
ncbi:hypothetical protein PDE_02657 [Penicillium oxalicum 114-2]|uniref:Xylanolytic transcriptional activator regulatory domain-containing protein n=1 Tax=Penicillium oxalicum (strain 114-2 / CGMCC 5302) TaxID=933388 RepID=S8AP67_PENO1|nr:hypothetical protein PDE_02657 [Penicillium oxalicum 114-2]